MPFVLISVFFFVVVVVVVAVVVVVVTVDLKEKRKRRRFAPINRFDSTSFSFLLTISLDDAGIRT